MPWLCPGLLQEEEIHLSQHCSPGLGGKYNCTYSQGPQTDCRICLTMHVTGYLVSHDLSFCPDFQLSAALREVRRPDLVMMT